MKIKIGPDVYFILLLLLSVLSHFFLPISRFISYPYSLAGIIFIVAGLALSFLTNRLLLEYKTSVQPFNLPDQFITHGAFRLSRNPIYLGMTMLLFGVAILLGSISSLFAPLLFFIIINFTIIPFEEQALTKLFGEKYTAYQKKVRRWL